MDIKEIASLNSNEIYELIGRELSESMELGETEPEEYQDRGKRWIKKYKDQLQKTICGGFVAETILNEKRQWDQVLLIASITDLIATLSIGVSPVVIATLLVKEGIEQLCHSDTE
ncbi:hypothetical protein MNBD_GAMMA07-2733 [hydrothermal vent metagenome]|uniref:Uncharacterized protein n=1 Tax=hydrothermal vent metagenome TaxID=652676 RepID=A0A3B0X498_9ZZZZ